MHAGFHNADVQGGGVNTTPTRYEIKLRRAYRKKQRIARLQRVLAIGGAFLILGQYLTQL